MFVALLPFVSAMLFVVLLSFVRIVLFVVLLWFVLRVLFVKLVLVSETVLPGRAVLFRAALLCVPGAFGRLARACALMPVAAYDHMNQASALLGRWLRARFGFSVAVLTFARAARAGLRRLPGARAAPQRPRAPPAPPLPGAATDRCRADRPRSVAVCRLQRRGERLGKRAILSSRRR